MLTECYLPLTVEAKSCTANFPVTFTFIFPLILSFDGYCLRLTKTHCKDYDNAACVIAVRDVKSHRCGKQIFREQSRADVRHHHRSSFDGSIDRQRYFGRNGIGPRSFSYPVFCTSHFTVTVPYRNVQRVL